MTRRFLQLLVALGGVILLARFGVPGLLIGGEWIAGDATIDPLLDSEARFLSVMAGGMGAIALWMLRDIERHGALLSIFMATVFLGGVARLVSLYELGTPPTKALVATGIELALPVFALPLYRAVARDASAQSVAARAPVGTHAS